MPYAGVSSQIVGPPAPKTSDQVVTDMRGLDLVSPYDNIQKNRSPFAHDFRLYAENTDDRRVAVSNRKGSGKYLLPYNETANVSNVSTTDADDAPVGITADWKAMKFTPSSGGRLTGVELRLKKTGGVNVLVSIYDDEDGTPNSLLASSGIIDSMITDTYSYVRTDFIEAPLLTSSTDYWIVVSLQDDSTGTVSWSSNTDSSDALTSSAGISGFSSTDYSLNFKTYLTPNTQVIGLARYAPDNAENKTLLACGQSMLAGNDSNGSLSAIRTTLNSSATNYYFTYADNKVFWVNGYDNLMTWDGSTPSSNSNLVTNGEFETNTAGWTAATGTTMTRDTSQSHSGAASMKLVSDSSHTAKSTVSFSFTVGNRYSLNMYVKGTASQTVVLTGAGQISSAFTLTGGWDLVSFNFTATVASSNYGVVSGANSATIYVDTVTMMYTGIQEITNSNLPICRLGVFHKNRFFGVSASDPNKIVWSEAPGNSDSSGNLWYNAYLSTSFIYVPAPHANDPITAIVSFQDTLIIYTRSGKWVLYGDNPGNFTLRQATGTKGAVSQDGIFVDQDYIYFVAPDGFYQYNGTSDALISDLIQPEFSSISDLDKVVVAKYNRTIRFYYPEGSSAFNNKCLVWHTVFQEWMLDTDTWVGRAIGLTDGNDSNYLVEASSLFVGAFYAEQDYNNLGKPINFAYWLKYNSYGAPAHRKRVQKFYPLLEGHKNSYPVKISYDKDRLNVPTEVDLSLDTGGAKIGSFVIGDGTKIGGTISFDPTRIRITGYFYYLQIRVERKAINNPIAFIGHELSFRTRKL